MAVNKHFSNGSFTFSAGLIDAYLLESGAARYPRVIISQDVMDLIFPDGEHIPVTLIREDDGLFFIDYLGATRTKKPRKLEESVTAIVAGLLSSTRPSVREKGLWLAHYSDSVLATQLRQPKFSGRKIQALVDS